MGDREKILQEILNAKVGETPLPLRESVSNDPAGTLQDFVAMVAAVGGQVIKLDSMAELSERVNTLFPSAKIVSTIEQSPWYSHPVVSDPHSFADVDLAVIRGHFGVAENGAVWITDSVMGDRAIPFIVQHLALVVDKSDIVSTLFDAYERIGSMQYDFGVFIAGPSKTADIEQSLVFGAHGPKSMIIFLIG